jgi:threonine dehydrogenase-like Zn-dependent dehydrogenase
MRAAVMRGRKLIVDDIAEPEPGPGQVLTKTLACGICGSDLHMLKFADRMVEIAERAGPGPAGGMDLNKDIVMGHEFCAEVLDYGPDTPKRLKPGTRVCSVPVLIGADSAEGVGYSNRIPGGYAERMVLSDAMLLEVPNGLASEHAAMTEPMAVGEHAVARANLGSDDLPLVIGCGPVGLAVIAALKLRGVGPVIAADFSPMRRKLAETLGADVVLDPAEGSPYAHWEDVASPDGYDKNAVMSMMGMGPQQRPGVIFECVGVPGVLQQILEGAMKGTRVIVVGVCMETDHIEPIFGINKELGVQFVLGYSPDEFASTLRNIAEGTIEVAPLVTGLVGVDEVPSAFEELGSPERHAKIVVEPWR